MPEQEDVTAIISGIFQINATLAEAAADVRAIRLLLEDDGEEGEEDQDG